MSTRVVQVRGCLPALLVLVLVTGLVVAGVATGFVLLAVGAAVAVLAAVVRFLVRAVRPPSAAPPPPPAKDRIVEVDVRPSEPRRLDD